MPYELCRSGESQAVLLSSASRDAFTTRTEFGPPADVPKRQLEPPLPGEGQLPLVAQRFKKICETIAAFGTCWCNATCLRSAMSETVPVKLVSEPSSQFPLPIAANKRFAAMGSGLADFPDGPRPVEHAA